MKRLGDDGANEDAPPRGSGWVGQVPPNTVTAKHWRPQADASRVSEILRRPLMEESRRNDHGILTEVWNHGTPHESCDGTSHGIPVPERSGGLVEKSHYWSLGADRHPAGEERE